MFAFGFWAIIKIFLYEKGACQNHMKTEFCIFLVLLSGPVKNALIFLLDWYQNVWVYGVAVPVTKGCKLRLQTRKPQVTIARNCRFPRVGTPGSQPGNQRLDYHCKQLRLELMLPNVGPGNQRLPIASNCRLPEVGTHASKRGNHRKPLQRSSSSYRLELMFPNMGTKVFMARKAKERQEPWGLTFYSYHILPLVTLLFRLGTMSFKTWETGILTIIAA